MSAFKISIDEDLFLIRTSPGILNRIMFFKTWSYLIELPVSRIARFEFETRAGINTLIVVKRTKEGDEKNIPVSLLKASSSQMRFMKKALPKILSNHSSMVEIKQLEKKYLKNKKVKYVS